MSVALGFALVLVFGAIILGWYSSKQKAGRAEECWLRFAQDTRLTFAPGPGGPLLGPFVEPDTPRVTGEYRGHPVDLRLDRQWEDVYDGVVPVACTVLSLRVRNPLRYSLSASELGFFAKVFGKKQEAVEINGPDSVFRVSAHPPEFAQEASRLLGPLLRQRPTEGIHYWGFWTSASKRPSIALEGGDLTWRQYDMVTDPHELRALLEQLADLAELTEKS